jgi:septal ring factor EnvC (AmiA/AmiB activator)
MAIFFMVTAGAALTSEAKHGNAVLELNLEPMQSNIRQIQRDLQSRFTEVDKLRTQINDTRQFLQSIEREKITQQAELRNIANEIEALSKLLGALEQKIAVVESNTKKALTPAPTGSP